MSTWLAVLLTVAWFAGMIAFTVNPPHNLNWRHGGVVVALVTGFWVASFWVERVTP
jgi:hypothetical protein